jgi:hypothetical protein
MLTSGKFTAGVINTGGKFATGVVDLLTGCNLMRLFIEGQEDS